MKLSFLSVQWSVKIRLRKVRLNQTLKVCIIVLRVIIFNQQVIPSHLIMNIQGSCHCAVNVYIEIIFVTVCLLFEWKWVQVIFVFCLYICLLFVLEIQLWRRENRIGGFIVSVLASSVADRVFEPRLGQPRDYEIGICCISAMKHTLRMNSTLVGSESG